MTNGPKPELTQPVEQPEEMSSVDAAAALAWSIERLDKQPSRGFTEMLEGVLISLRTSDPCFMGRNRPTDMMIHRLAVDTAKNMVRDYQTDRMASVYPLAQFRCTLAQGPCAQARTLHGTIFPSEAPRPKLPLPGCRVLSCACRYRLMTTRQAEMQGHLNREADGDAPSPDA